jgi:hypothetical protein
MPRVTAGYLKQGFLEMLIFIHSYVEPSEKVLELLQDD